MTDDAALYRLAKKSSLWIEFTPSGHDLTPTWQLQVSARGRGAKIHSVLLETTALRPLAAISIKGETYPLPIHWHERKRGGIFCFGGERKLGAQGGVVAWEMRWRPFGGNDLCFLAEMRVRATPRRNGHLHLSLNTPLHLPELWSLPAAAARGHNATVAHSAYSRAAVGWAMLEGESGWDEQAGGFGTTLRSHPLGGGKVVRFSLLFLESSVLAPTRGPLVAQYAALAGSLLHPLEEIVPFAPWEAAARLNDPASYEVKGAERLYLKPPIPEPGAFYAGSPYDPADALCALWNWGRLHPRDNIARLVRFGGRGLAADFQVMGRAGESEPNKGAFWDKRVGDSFSDYAGGQTHGIASNARLARALFLLHEAMEEPLFRQSALNICQWFILKQNFEGYFDGERVHATRGLPSDGKFLPQPCSLDGAEAIRPLVLAHRTTANEVYVKAAWKIANVLLERMDDFEAESPAAVASVISALLALDAAAPNDRLRAGVRAWGAWLRALPLSATAPFLNSDGLHGGLYDCALAGFSLYALERDTAYLRYAFAALRAVPPASHAASPRAITASHAALLAIACLLPGAQPNFDALSLTLGWRTYAPDPATEQFLRVLAADGSPLDFLPLVCRLNDQLLLIVLAPPTVEAITVLKNGKRPLLRDALTDTLDSAADLHPLEDWVRVGLFTIYS